MGLRSETVGMREIVSRWKVSAKTRLNLAPSILILVVLKFYPYNAQNEPNNATRDDFVRLHLIRPSY